ncbi:hypothetical protein GCM10027614_69380 [Micromonospora vulcania]
MRHFREPAPGPLQPLLLPPEAAAIAATPYWVFHPFGVEQRRADTLRRAAALADRLERCADATEATRRLVAVPGIGPWTAAEVVRIAYGDPDAVSVGDFHVPNTVAWALAGEPRGDDARMLALLEPFRGHAAGCVCCWRPPASRRRSTARAPRSARSPGSEQRRRSAVGAEPAQRATQPPGVRVLHAPGGRAGGAGEPADRAAERAYLEPDRVGVVAADHERLLPRSGCPGRVP